MVDLQIDRENQQWASRPGDAYQRMASAGSLAAQRGGTALGDAFGIVDPRKAMAQKVQDALKEIKDLGVDLNQDPVEFYTAMSKAFASRGLMEQATQASMKAMELKDKSAERADKESSRANKLAIENIQLAEAQAKLKMAMAKAQGKPEANALMEIIKDNYKDASVESVTAAYEVLNSGGSLIEAQKKLQTKRENEKMIGTTPDGLPVYRKEGEATYVIQSGQKVPYEGSVKPTGGVTVDNRQDTSDEKTRVFEFEQGYKEYVARQKEVKAVQTPLKVMRKVLDSGKLTTGAYADQRTELNRIGAALGVKIDPKVANNDDLFDAMVMNVVLPKMAMLGGNDSEEELKKIRESTGSRKFTIETLSQVLSVAEDAVRKAEEEADSYESHRASGGRPLDFNFVRGRPYRGAKEGTAKTPTRENGSIPQPSQPSYTPSVSEIDRYKAQLSRIGAAIPDDEAIRQKLIQAKRK